MRNRNGNRQNMQQGEDADSSSSVGGPDGSGGPSSSLADDAGGSADPSSTRDDGSAGPSSSGTGGFLGGVASSVTASSRSRKPADSPPVQGEHKNPASENNCGDLWYKTACEGSTATKPCGR